MERSPTQLPVENKLIYKAFMDRGRRIVAGARISTVQSISSLASKDSGPTAAAKTFSSGSARIIKAVSEGEKGIIW